MLACGRCLAPLDSKVLSLHQTQGGSLGSGACSPATPRAIVTSDTSIPRT